MAASWGQNFIRASSYNSLPSNLKRGLWCILYTLKSKLYKEKYGVGINWWNFQQWRFSQNTGIYDYVKRNSLFINSLIPLCALQNAPYCESKIWNIIMEDQDWVHLLTKTKVESTIRKYLSNHFARVGLLVN